MPANTLSTYSNNSLITLNIIANENLTLVDHREEKPIGVHGTHRGKETTHKTHITCIYVYVSKYDLVAHKV